MAKLSSIKDLRNYCLGSLGAPVINIEIDEGQISDRIQDAIEFFMERHYDGVEECYYTHYITSNDIANNCIPMPDNLQAVTDVQVANAGLSANGINIEGFGLLVPEFTTDTMLGFAKHGQLTDYYITRGHYSMVKDLLTPHVNYTYTPATHIMRLDGFDMKVGKMILIRGYRTVDPEDFVDVYNERFIKKYATALLKKQWGTNLKKYDGVQLAGGQIMAGQKIYDEAIEEIDKLEEDFEERYEFMPSLLIG